MSLYVSPWLYICWRSHLVFLTASLVAREPAAAADAAAGCSIGGSLEVLASLLRLVCALADSQEAGGPFIWIYGGPLLCCLSPIVGPLLTAASVPTPGESPTSPPPAAAAPAAAAATAGESPTAAAAAVTAAQMLLEVTPGWTEAGQETSFAAVRLLLLLLLLLLLQFLSLV